MENHSLIIKGLKKQYHDTYALNNIDIEFNDGIYGILGPNGAGKSTLMKILTLNIKPTNGYVLYNNESIFSLKQNYLTQIGYVPQHQSLYNNLTALEFMYYIGYLKGLSKYITIEQSEKYLKFVHLYDDRNKKIHAFSGGMKQRLLLAQSLLGDPKIILLDEPTAGVDPMERVVIRKLIKQISLHRIILITTHIISDIEDMTDNIVMMNKGNIIYNGKKEDLLTEYNVLSLEDAYVKVFGINYDKNDLEKI